MSNELATTNQGALSTGLVKSMQDVQALAIMLSGGDQNKQAIALNVQRILYGLDIGIGIGAAIAGIYIVDGKPTIGAGVMSAAIRGSSKYDYEVAEDTKEKCRLFFFQNGKQIGIVETTLADFEHLKKKNNWTNYPDDMLFARAISKGLRRFCPDVFGMTVYVEGEIENGQAEPINVTPQEQPAKPKSSKKAKAVPTPVSLKVLEERITEASKSQSRSGIQLVLKQARKEHPDALDVLAAFASGEWEKHNGAEEEPAYAQDIHPPKQADQLSIGGGS